MLLLQIYDEEDVRRDMLNETITICEYSITDAINNRYNMEKVIS